MKTPYIRFVLFFLLLTAVFSACQEEPQATPVANENTVVATNTPPTEPTAEPSATPLPATTTSEPTHTPTAVPPTHTPTPEPTATAVSYLIPPIAGQPLEPLALYDYNVATGVWEEGEGLVQILGLYLGQIDPTTIEFADDLIDSELTPILARAEAYIAIGENETAVSELERIMASLVPSDDVLEEYAQPATSASLPNPHHLGRLLPARQIGDQQRCLDLFDEGFPPGANTICLEYITTEINGRIFRLYYPIYWPADDPRRAQLPQIMQAVQTAVPIFNSYGPQPIMSTVLVVTELAEGEAEGHPHPDIYAKAKSGGTSCHVGIFPSSFRIEAPKMQQSIAHELFHCYQYTNLTAQESGPNAAANEWWVEGSADYFSDVVYPNINHEHRWLPHIRANATDEPLTSWRYKAFIFFEYLANNMGMTPDQIIALLASMPTSGGTPEQQAALSTQTGMQDAFHQFARALAGNQVHDTNGSSYTTAFNPDTPVHFNAESGSQLFPAEPFLIVYQEIALKENNDYAFVLSASGGEGRSVAQPGEAVGVWVPMPSTVSTCTPLNYRLLITSAATSDHMLNVAYTATPTTHCDSCLYGTWQMDNNSYLALMQSLTPPGGGDVQTQDERAEGSAMMTFFEDGRFESVFNGFTVYSTLVPDGGPTMQIELRFSGGSNGTYAASGDQLSTTVTASTISAVSYMNGQVVGNFPGNAIGTIGGGKYICSDAQLLLGPNPPQLAVNPNAPWLAMNRVTP